MYRGVQQPGDFMITFPRAYHSGFNTGFNCAEAVNFVPPDWLRFQKTSVDRYKRFRKVYTLPTNQQKVLTVHAVFKKYCISL